MAKPAYTAVVLNPLDQNNLRATMCEILDGGLREAGFVEQNARGVRLSHHMTICMGVCPDVLKDQLGVDKVITVDAWGMTDQALAVRVDKASLKWAKNKCMNTYPHVTVAVNQQNFGSPKDSNDIVEWTLFDQSFDLAGVLKEVHH